ncbi:Dimeric alpha+beta barrel [Glarea lozoyensis ATCC 20868]|uniref:Dimeric alpha+beta barrel n=1 Tax=Glarea lozoyensis (strain ATCC 20868 / MF5171) TaxID=1116229 RepID=S3CWF0_GLAL2|nr:Dimeric alpha+beta barrel [Glarea lozoyensis ATCC 20868]EPE29254.1 Dimeric alpha+beta barrel [Glarea lozoyensis ATCC 20868]
MVNFNSHSIDLKLLLCKSGTTLFITIKLVAMSGDSSPERLFRVTVFFKRKPGMTEEEFNHHWENVHGPLVADWAVKHGIVQYTQFFTPSHLRQRITSNVPSAGVLDYDSGVDWYVRDYDAYERAYEDPYYLEVIEPDEWNFIDKSGGETGGIATAVSTLGVCRDIVRDGKSMVGKPVLDQRQKDLLESSIE